MDKTKNTNLTGYDCICGNKMRIAINLSMSNEELNKQMDKVKEIHVCKCGRKYGFKTIDNRAAMPYEIKDNENSRIS